MENSFELDFFAVSDIGRVRKNNEDYTTFFVPLNKEDGKRNGSLFIVADGVGGASKGEIASKYAADSVLYEYYQESSLPPAERLKKAIQKANRDIHFHSQESGSFQRMATTIVAALVLNDQLIVASVGDSRLYLLRDGKITQVTRDHSIVEEMVRDGMMTVEEARNSKIKNRITRSVGGEAEVHVDVSQPCTLKIGDRLLLCTDGLTRYLDGDELAEKAKSGKPEQTSKELIKLANSRGGADNVSLILVDIKQKAKAHPLIKIARPERPLEQMALEQMETEYDLAKKPKKKWGLWIKIGVIALAIMIVAAMVYCFFPGGLRKHNVSEIAENHPGANEITPTAFPEAAPTSFAPGAEVTMAPQTSETSGSQMLSTETGIPATPAAESDWECVYEVGGVPGDKMGANAIYGDFLAENIYIKYNKGVCKEINSTHYEEVNCTENSYSFANEPGKIDNGEWLVIRFQIDSDNSKAKCLEKTSAQRSGRIHILNSGGNE